MKITDNIVKEIIRKVILSQDYRIEVVTLIDAEFLEYVIDFFKRIVAAKLSNSKITTDWYKREMLNTILPKDQIAINSGLNLKTITNMYNSARKQIVLDASMDHYDSLYEAINALVESNDDVSINLTIKFGAVSVDLNINESLIVINTLAVKRSAIRGGLWSSAGKQAEKVLMKALCKIFSVPDKYYQEISDSGSLREVDFYILNKDMKRFRCEVKLMGMGNPESADVAFARQSNIFVADKLSDKNKKQLSKWGIEWIELRSKEGYKRFLEVLQRKNVPCSDFQEVIEERLNEVLPQIFS